ncbi:hypothetical protein F4860DRAFT_446754 [Xylaria cubensis]|nr:hypothetical protein F4860DRAFT_446754 [Xylaria cubensis]
MMGLFKSPSNAGRSRPGPAPRSNIRGNISGPIPIPDDEFPMRNPGSSIAQEARPKKLDSEIQRDSTAASISSVYNGNGAREDKTNSLTHSGPSQTSTNSTHARRRTNRSSTVRYSTMSEATDSAASPSRKKSSFRAAIGKLFKKRNRKQSSRSASGSEAHSTPPVDHHRSDPVTAERGPTDSETEPKRSVSLPVTEFNKALRSHSIGPDDYMAIHSARNSLQSDSVFLRRRAVTTSGGPIISKPRDESTDISGLSPRPASAQGHDMVDDYDPESIGRAVSVDYITSRRRSRSLSQLPDVSEGHGLVRKRSEEIRYWRASQNPGPLSSDPSVSNREQPLATEPTVSITETHGESQPLDAPESFNFRSISTMRITQAASLEDRVSTLEVQNQKLERLVSKLFQVVPGIDRYSTTSHPAPVASMAPPTTHATTLVHQGRPVEIDPLSPSYSVSEQSNVSFEDEKTFIGSIRPPTREAPRPISNVTIRGATSLPTLSKDTPHPFTSDHYNTLRSLLDDERAARHALEIRVTQLAQMIHTMSRPTHKLHVNTSSGVELPVSTFEHDDDDEDDEDEEPPSASIDDSSDAFKTPGEERPIHDYDDFGDDEVDDGSRKRAARTLSLGQLTLGKPKHSQKPGAGVDL